MPTDDEVGVRPRKRFDARHPVFAEIKVGDRERRAQHPAVRVKPLGHDARPFRAQIGLPNRDDRPIVQRRDGGLSLKSSEIAEVDPHRVADGCPMRVEALTCDVPRGGRRNLRAAISPNREETAIAQRGHADEALRVVGVLVDRKVRADRRAVGRQQTSAKIGGR